MPRSLTPRERSFLKAQAHSLDPVVTIGARGLTPAVVGEIDRALTSHELIKVRVGEDDRDARKGLFVETCQRTGAAPVGHVGKILILWRARPAEAETERTPSAQQRQQRPSRRE
jgi:putative YhbY family RNA-binding protein